MALDVFNRHRGVVHKNADRQGQTPQRHEIDRLPERTQDGQRGQDRKRNGYRDDERAAPGPEKEQDHQPGQSRCDDTFADDPADRRRDEKGLIAELLHLHVAGHGFQNSDHGGLDSAGDIERGGAAVLQDAEHGAAHAILTDHVLLRQIAIADLGHVLKANYRSIYGLNRQVFQRVNERGTGVEIDRIFLGIDLDRAAGEDKVLNIECVDNVLCREALCFQRLEI